MWCSCGHLSAYSWFILSHCISRKSVNPRLVAFIHLKLSTLQVIACIYTSEKIAFLYICVIGCITPLVSARCLIKSATYSDVVLQLFVMLLVWSVFLQHCVVAFCLVASGSELFLP
jgi:hypothetical protein